MHLFTDAIPFVCVLAMCIVAMRAHRSSEKLAEKLAHLTEQLLILKGAHPHHVAPETFTSGGVSWTVHDEVLKAEQRMREANELPGERADAIDTSEYVPFDKWVGGEESDFPTAGPVKKN